MKEIGPDPTRPHWKIAEDFLIKCHEENVTIIYSGFVLKELEHIAGKEQMQNKLDVLDESTDIKRIFATKEDWKLARKIECETEYIISFYDIFHMILAKRFNAVLITRDRKLLEISKKYFVEAMVPEQLLS